MDTFDLTKEPAEKLGFIPQYQPMTEDQTKMFINVYLGEPNGELSDEEAPFPIKILRKRIEVLKLPIKFSMKGEFIALIFSDGNPGKMMTILIDCLTDYEGKEVGAEELSNIYPNGFYSENSFMDYVDNYIKTRLCKWSELY